ncbi:hypothetical protein HDU76_009599, partial [Blyttiomyces sp. JEL0837]
MMQDQQQQQQQQQRKAAADGQHPQPSSSLSSLSSLSSTSSSHPPDPSDEPDTNLERTIVKHTLRNTSALFFVPATAVILSSFLVSSLPLILIILLSLYFGLLSAVALHGSLSAIAVKLRKVFTITRSPTGNIQIELVKKLPASPIPTVKHLPSKSDSKLSFVQSDNGDKPPPSTVINQFTESVKADFRHAQLLQDSGMRLRNVFRDKWNLDKDDALGSDVSGAFNMQPFTNKESDGDGVRPSDTSIGDVGSRKVERDGSVTTTIATKPKRTYAEIVKGALKPASERVVKVFVVGFLALPVMVHATSSLATTAVLDLSWMTMKGVKKTVPIV